MTSLRFPIVGAGKTQRCEDRRAAKITVSLDSEEASLHSEAARRERGWNFTSDRRFTVSE